MLQVELPSGPGQQVLIGLIRVAAKVPWSCMRNRSGSSGAGAGGATGVTGACKAHPSGCNGSPGSERNGYCSAATGLKRSAS